MSYLENIGKNAKMFAPKGAKIEVQDKDGKIIESGVAKQDGMYYKVFNAAEESQTIRRGISYEATELSRQSGADLREPNRIKQKIEVVLLICKFKTNENIESMSNWCKQLELNSKYWKDKTRIQMEKIISLHQGYHG